MRCFLCKVQRIKVYANIIIRVQNGVNGMVCHK